MPGVLVSGMLGQAQHRRQAGAATHPAAPGARAETHDHRRDQQEMEPLLPETHPLARSRSSALCLRLRRGPGVRRWGLDGRGRGVRGGGARGRGVIEGAGASEIA
jgi:hypothetical protein